MAGKRFKFALENVLKLRHHEAERARQDFLNAAAERERQEQAVAAARLRLHELIAAPAQAGPVGPVMLRQRDAFRRDAQRACLQAERALTEKKTHEEKARLQLVERRRAEEALQNLRDQRRDEHVREQDAQDLSFLDDQAISIYGRKK